MIFENITEAYGVFLRGQKLLGLDYGTKTIGIALSDKRWQIASPLKTITRRKFTTDIVALCALIEQEQVGGIIMGLPLTLMAVPGKRVQSTRAFARNLADHFTGAISFWDERLSTIAAERALLEADMSRAKRARLVNHVAASYILQGALDRLAQYAKNTT